MGVAPMTRQNRQQHGAKQIAFAGRIRAGEQQRAVIHPPVEQPGLFQVIDEERQLTKRRHRSRYIPFDAHTPSESVGDRRMPRNFRLLTHRVNHQTSPFSAHAGQFR